MGEVKTKKQAGSKKNPPPSSVTLDLFAPGMTMLHRAGLGGLAATLKAMERRHRLGRLRDDELPEGPDLGDGYPWRVEPMAVTLDWGKPAAAREYLRRLFAFAFGIKDKLIDLPGTYRDELSRAVRAELQLGIESTFLTHAPTAGSRAGLTTFNVGIEDVPFLIRHMIFTSFRHQGWYWLERDEKEVVVDPVTGKKSKKSTGQRVKLRSSLECVDEHGSFVDGCFSIDKKLFPGAIVRHAGFGERTAAFENARSLLCLYFALVGCLCLQGPRRIVHDKRAKKRVPKATGVLIAPSVTNLEQFARVRARMTPATVSACRIAAASDAVLQALVRLKAKRLMGRHGFDAIHGVHLAPTDWASDQPSRVDTVVVDASCPVQDRRLTQYQVALGRLPPRIRSKEVKHSVGRGHGRTATPETVWFWAESVVRPLVAENLARGRRWYDGFCDLAADRDMTHRIRYEMKGLQAMANDKDLIDDDEMMLIRALHRAVAIGLGRIYDEMGRPSKDQHGKYPSTLTKRWERFRERARLALVGAKTQSQTQDAVSIILARAGVVSELQDARALRQVKDLVFGDDWRRARDLALFALASYVKPADIKALPEGTEGLDRLGDETETNLKIEE